MKDVYTREEVKALIREAMALKTGNSRLHEDKPFPRDRNTHEIWHGYHDINADMAAKKGNNMLAMDHRAAKTQHARALKMIASNHPDALRQSRKAMDHTYNLGGLYRE